MQSLKPVRLARILLPALISALCSGMPRSVLATEGDLLAVGPDPLGAAGDEFGRSISVFGNDVLVGAPLAEDQGIPGSGAAFLVEGGSGVTLLGYSNPDPDGGDEFGFSLAASNDRVAIGAPGESGTVAFGGEVYVFDAFDASPLLTIQAPTLDPNARFGESLAVIGNEIFVGAPGVTGTFSGEGAVYVYDITVNGVTSVPLRSLPHPAPAADSGYGGRVIVLGTNLVVSAPSHDSPFSDAGIAYLVEPAAGTMLVPFYSPTPGTGDLFGSALAAAGANVLIGSPYDDDGAADAGAAFLMNGTGGELLVSIENPTPDAGDLFGEAVASNGYDLFIGAPGDDAFGADAGTAHAFEGSVGGYWFEFTNPTPSPGDAFGRALTGLGSSIAVTASGDADSGPGTGTYYLFEGYTGTPVIGPGDYIAALYNPTPVANEMFGMDLAVLPGPKLAISAPGEPAGGGNIHVFDPGTGNLDLTIPNASPDPGDSFGWSISALGGDLIAGSPFDDANGPDSGAAFVVNGSTGAPVFTLTPPAPAAGDNFGTVVTEVNGNIAVSAPGADGGFSDEGVIHIFSGSTGFHQLTLLNPSAAPNDHLGGVLSSLGPLVIAGTPEKDAAFADEGVVYLFNEGTGSLLLTLSNPTPAVGDLFGRAVAGLGGVVIVGAPGDDTTATDGGTVYMFDAGTGSLLMTIPNPAPDAGDFFGGAVSAAGTNIVVLARNDDGYGSADTGTAYVFDSVDGSLLLTLHNPAQGASELFGASVASPGGDFYIGVPDSNVTDTGAGFVFGFMGLPPPVASGIGPCQDIAGECRTGDRVSIYACAQPESAWTGVQTVAFEYRPSGGGPFSPIPAADPANPNPDPDYPFFIHWDVISMPPGAYDIRSVTTDEFGATEASPAFVTMNVNAGCPNREILNGTGDVEIQEPVFSALDNTIEGGSDENDFFFNLEIPSGALTGDTSITAVIPDPASFAGTLGPLVDTGCYVDFLLANGQGAPPRKMEKDFANGRVGMLNMDYPDRDNDGYLDGFLIREETLRMFNFDSGSGTWVIVPIQSTNYQLNRITAGSLQRVGTFAIFAVTSSASAWEAYE